MRELDIRVTDDRQVRVLDSGPETAPAVVLFHGAPNSRYFVPPDAAGDFRVVTFDRPGYGQSSPISRRRSVADVGTEVACLLDELSVDRAMVVGVSAGDPMPSQLPQSCRSASRAWRSSAASVRFQAAALHEA